MKKVFWDANIGIDFVINRVPWCSLAANIFDMAVDGKVLLHCSTLSLGTMSYYMERQKMSYGDIVNKLSNFISVCAPLPVDISVAKSALKSSFKDFEDAMQYFAAMNEGCDVIITRDKRGFVESTIPVMEPQEFLDEFENTETE